MDWNYWYVRVWSRCNIGWTRRLGMGEEKMRLWGKDEERGALLGAIGAIVLFTFVFPDPDVDLGVVFPGNPPYGLLWKLLNPFYWTKTLYPMIVFAEWAGVTSLEWWLAKKGFLSSGLVKLQIFSVTVLLMLHATQDVTVIMFAPLVMGSWIFVGLEIFQKIPMPGTPEWTCAFQGTGTDANAYLYPCLSNSTHFFTWNHIYWLTYPILALWVVLPLVLHYERETKLGRVVGGQVSSNVDDRARKAGYDV